MNEVVWVALISGGSTLAASLATQFLVTRAAAKQAARAEMHEALKWRRYEGKQSRERNEARLREFWEAVLAAQNRILDHQARSRFSKGLGPASDSAASAAAQAYAIALLGFEKLRPLAKDFYNSTALVQMNLDFGKSDTEAMTHWRENFEALEDVVAKFLPEYDSGEAPPPP